MVTIVAPQFRLFADHRRERAGRGHRALGGVRSKDGPDRLDRNAVPQNVQQGVSESGQSHSRKFGRTAGKSVTTFFSS